jgi:hypothetical protein
MGLLIRVDTTLTGDTYVCILADPCTHSCLLCIPTNLSNSTRTVQHPTRPELQHSGFRNTLLCLNTSTDHQTPHIWILSSISGMPCNLLFRRDLHPSYCYRFMDNPAACMVLIPSSTILDIRRVHATLCCGTSACSRGPYTILGRCRPTSFFGSSVYILSQAGRELESRIQVLKHFYFKIS